MEILEWLQTWFLQQCDGEWEHENEIKIDTVSNPGWYITIDLAYTNLENFEFYMDTVEFTENDWYFYHVKNAKFTASGDPSKLSFLLHKFKEIVDENG